MVPLGHHYQAYLGRLHANWFGCSSQTTQGIKANYKGVWSRARSLSIWVLAKTRFIIASPKDPEMTTPASQPLGEEEHG